jgi:aspartyl/asparaginyl beta-hydroxylase (cupin superfamily)
MNDPAKAQLEAIFREGVDALRAGDARRARRALEEVTTSGRASAQVWLLLAQSCDMIDDRPAARSALNEVLKADPVNPYAAVMHGEMLTRDGEDRAAVAWYDRALRLASGIPNLPADLIERLRRAEATRNAVMQRFDNQVTASLEAASVDAEATGARFAEALAILSGRTQPMLQQPSNFYFPRLPQIPFYDPADFDWVPVLEAAYPSIRAEAEAVLADRSGVAPYVKRPENRPINKTHSLMEDPRWSAFHLIRDGEVVAANAARCPATMAALQVPPIPVIAGRSPLALFSILEPGTHIEPHNGMLNTRLICHLPLIVPDNCALRVGNETRMVEAGKMMIFDDSIEHEAWNRSDEIRVILLFEIWRPELTAAERTGLTALFESVTHYSNEH